MKINQPGDDLFTDRLLFYLQRKFPFPVQKIIPVKKQVYKIQTNDQIFILKGFCSYRHLKIQREFADCLMKEGFAGTCPFLHLHEEPLFFQGYYYGCLKYLPPAPVPFSFKNARDRLRGLALLKRYHQVSGRLVKFFESDIARHNILQKWRQRTASFLKNLAMIKYFVQKEILAEMLMWADWSLKGLGQCSRRRKEKRTVILHGDVADHNFLLARDGSLYLIDFDLIKIGDPLWDYLQYASRILPFLNWSVTELKRMEEISRFFREDAFIFALAYPADIFREWNRAIREGSFARQDKLEFLFHITVEQFSERQKFFKDLQNLADKMAR